MLASYLTITANRIKNPKSRWQPTEDERDVLGYITRDYEIGNINLNKPFMELNNQSVISAYNTYYQQALGYIPPRSWDPDNDWRANVKRPLTMVKAQVLVTHATTRMLSPHFTAVDEFNEERKDFSDFAELSTSWVIDHSDYKYAYASACIGVMYSPAVIVETGYSAPKKFVRVGNEVRIEDDELESGFFLKSIPVDSFLIANPYEPKVQKQRFVIAIDYMDYFDAEKLYKKSDNWQYVTPGTMNIFYPVNSTVYTSNTLFNENQRWLVQRVRYFNKSEDLAVILINGIPVTDVKNPNPRIDKAYPFEKLIFEQVDEGKFFYGRPLAQKIYHDERFLDALYSAYMDMITLSLQPPVVNYGREELTANMFRPGSSASLSKDSKVANLLPQIDFNGAAQAIQYLEKNISESSLDNIMGGGQGSATRTAREVVLAQQNSETMIMGGFVARIKEMVEGLGKLIISDFVQHMTVGDLDEVTGEMKYKKLVLRERPVKGQSSSYNIRFVPDLKETDARSLELLDEMISKKQNTDIIECDPKILRKIRWYSYVNADEYEQKNNALQKAQATEFYTLMLQNPLIDPDTLTRTVVDQYYPGKVNAFMKEEEAPMLPEPTQQTNPMSQQLSDINGMVNNSKTMTSGGVIENTIAQGGNPQGSPENRNFA